MFQSRIPRVFLLSLAVTSLVGSPVAADSLVLSPGVLVDTQTQSAFVMAPGGQVKAIDINSGTARWSSDAASVPLHLHRGQLYAGGEGAEAADHLEVLRLDPRSGELKASTRVALPQTVHTKVDQALGKAFECATDVEDGQLVLSWRAYISDIRGVGPTFDPAALINPRAQKVQAGTVERLGGDVVLDEKSGQWRELGAEKSKQLQRQRAKESATGLYLSGDERLAGVNGHQYLSVDGRHVLSSELTGRGLSWLWHVYERESGKLLASFERDSARESFLVRGQNLLVVTGAGGERRADGSVGFRGPQLMSIGFDGSTRYQVELRDNAYRGPHPH